jgi:two-component system LytT family response regulator
MKIRTLIVDDEPLGRKHVRKLLEREAEFPIIGECADGREAVRAINKHSPDLVFLDVQMPEVSGFEVLERIAPEQMPIIIFVTAFDKFAVKAFEAHALDYLLKPFDEDRFGKALERAKKQFSKGATGEMTGRLVQLLNHLPPERKFIARLAVKAEGKIVFLKAPEIDWIEAAENYANLHVGKDVFWLRGRLSELAKSLDPEQFFRIHRSTIVNLDRVKEFHPLFKGEGVVILKDGVRLAVSRNCSQKLQESLTHQF